jgi:hypothetical protein
MNTRRKFDNDAVPARIFVEEIGLGRAAGNIGLLQSE